MIETDNATAAAGASEFRPPLPKTVEETGLPRLFIEQLVLKVLYQRTEINGRNLADFVGLPFRVIDSIMQDLQNRHLVEVKGSLGYGPVSSVFSLTESGRNRSRECLELNQYSGVAPVPLEQYTAVVAAQRQRKGWITREKLVAAYQHMVMRDAVLSQIGPAVNSGKSLLIFGDPGNGKTYMAEALADLDSEPVFVPHAIEQNGSIIQVFNRLHHRELRPESGLFALAAGVLESEQPYDTRWVKCKRPFLVSGGELSPEMLELRFNDTTKVYDAPLHLQANNGIYLIDDFGRQKITPAELLNRWIIPMESRVDHLSIPTGGKLSVPFEVYLVFSTNLSPQQIGDEAFLRRIQYKMSVKNPDHEEFLRILTSVCDARGLGYSSPLFDRFMAKHYTSSGRPMRRCHARDVITHATDLIDFERLPPVLTDDLLDRSFESCFAGT